MAAAELMTGSLRTQQGVGLLIMGLMSELSRASRYLPAASRVRAACPGWRAGRRSGQSVVGAALICVLMSVVAVPAVAQKGAAKPDQAVAQLKSRVEQLEEQLVDMRVIIGTLQSLAKAPAAGGGVPAGGAASGGGVDAGRLAILETQIRALTAQVERLSGQLGNAPPVPPPSGGGFGSTTVTPGGAPAAGGDRIGNFISRNHQPNSSQWGQPPSSGPVAGAGTPEAAYRDAYGAWLQGDVQAAQTGFQNFLTTHNRHALAGDAQYWLGETYFKQNQFQLAAKAFLAGYQTYSTNPKAPDSLLRLAASLDKLGERGAACSSLGELRARFPQADQRVIRQLRADQRRMGC